MLKTAHLTLFLLSQAENVMSTGQTKLAGMGDLNALLEQHDALMQQAEAEQLELRARIDELARQTDAVLDRLGVSA